MINSMLGVQLRVDTRKTQAGIKCRESTILNSSLPPTKSSTILSFLTMIYPEKENPSNPGYGVEGLTFS